MTAIGLLCCCDAMLTTRGPSLIHANEDVKASGWRWQTRDGYCVVRCPRCQAQPLVKDYSGLTIAVWRGDVVEIQVSLTEKGNPHLTI